jgi:CRISPR-associated protein Cmr4
MNIQHLYLLSPLHTGGTTQEGNLLGIARESHTNFPYIPSSTIRGRLRAAVDDNKRDALFGNDLNSNNGNLTQGSVWVGDGSLLWLPVPSLSHGVIWISCPLLLNRYARVANVTARPAIVPYLYNFHQANEKVYLKDAIFDSSELTNWDKEQAKKFIPHQSNVAIERALVLPDQHCATVIQMGLWRQVKIKLDQHKTVDGGFRYEEAIPPDTLMYFPWGITAQAKGNEEAREHFLDLLATNEIMQIGGQESLGRGFVECF